MGGIYNYIKLTDVLGDYITQDPVAGADIDAVGVISSVPIPAAVWLFGSGLIGVVGIWRGYEKKKLYYV